MLIHLSEISQAEGKSEEMHIAYEPDAVVISGESFPISNKEDAVFRLSCIQKGKVHVEGSFSLEAAAPCDRCLTEVTVPVSVTFEEEIDVEETGAELDADELLYKEILMRWPMKILCKEECKGICMKCGKDLNEGDCGCDTFVPDPRMAAILDVFNNSK